MLLWGSMQTYAQNASKDSINVYLKQIENLIVNKNKFKDDFLDEKTLLINKNKVQGIVRARVLLKLYEVTKYKSVETANKYNEQALQLSKSIGYKQGELNAIYNHAYLLFINGLFNESMEVTKKTIKIIDPIYYPNTYADFKTLESDIYTERGEYDLALETGLKLLDLAEKSKSNYLLMKAYASLSHYYLRVENYQKALSYCIKGLDYIIKLREIQYIFPKIDEIARMSSKLKYTDRALKIYDFYLDIEKKITPPGSYIQSNVYMNIADIYMYNKEYTKAQDYLSKALEMNYINKYRFRIPRALILQGELYLKVKDTTNAILSYEKSLAAAEEINAFDVVKSNSSILSRLYEKRNQLSKAYEYKTLYTAIRDSLFNNEVEQKIIILEARRKIKEVTQKERILDLEYKAHKVKSSAIISILLLISIISIFIVFAYLKVKTKNKFLYIRTIELAQIQMEMNEKLNHLKNTETTLKTPLLDEATTKNSQPIDEDIKDIILSKLENLEKENFFIDSNCNMHQLALKLKTNPKYLSQVINQEKKLNFNNYINELRINYLLTILIKDEDFRNNKLSYIATAIGFNNLNTFNTAFKKRLGILPSYFISELIQEVKEKKQP